MSQPTPLHPRPRFTPGIAAEGWMEIREQARLLQEFIERELRDSWVRDRDAARLRRLQAAHERCRVIERQGLRMAGWAEGLPHCADEIVSAPGHGEAA